MLRSTLLFVLSIAAAALAAPHNQYDGPFAMLDKRDLLGKRACPTTFWWKSYSYSTTWKSTTTITNTVSSMRSVTSTKTEHETRTGTTRTTVTSPATLTLPATTITSNIPAPTTSTLAWWTDDVTTTLPGFAPPSVCELTTRTSTIPSTTSVTWTQDLFYATTWLSLEGHVSTTTSITVTTTTRTVTEPGATTYLTTQTFRNTFTPVDIVTATVTHTVWEKGCERWACDA